MRRVLADITIGAVAAIGLTRWMQNLLYELSPTDPLTFSTIVLLLLTVALAACYLPARRATKIDPLQALRQE